MQRSKRRLVSCVSLGLLLSSAMPASFAQTSAPALLAPPWQQRAIPSAFGTQRTFPIASHGYLLSHARTIRPGRPQSLFLTALKTGRETALPFWLPDAASIRLESGTVSASGEILLAGSYARSRGAVRRAQAKADVNFVARVDRRGRVLAVNDLGDYTPERICAASNGSFWTLGQVWSRENQASARKEQGAYSMLREYSPAGVLKRSFLPRSRLPRGVVLNYHAHAPQANWAFLRCGDDSVAAYVGRGTAFYLWTEVNTATGQTKSWSVRTLPGRTMTGLALLSEHTAYASFRPGGLYQLQAVPTKPARWTPVPLVAAANAGEDQAAFSILLGRDGPNLVHLNGTKSPRKNPVVYWSTPSR